ncbi:MAG TPA: nuclear transport factor 2 family protein [Candidatus Udaeobacter sp.]
MKTQITYLITALTVLLSTIAVSNAAPPDKAAMEGKDKAAWQAFKDKNEVEFRKIVDKDFRGVYDDGIVNLQQELDGMKKWDMKSFEISGYDMFSDEKDVVVATYKVKLEGTSDGKDMSGVYNAGTVWKQENGKWMAIFHTNIKSTAGQ